MNEVGSGTYVIDSEYNIINYNQTAKDIYPMLTKGHKCYKVLMGLERPCDVCPVFNGIKGPRTYFDPIRRIYETVDAVEMPLADGSMGHALIFSTVGEQVEKAIEMAETLKAIEVDEVMGIYTRQAFYHHMREMLDKYPDDSISLFIADIENFKLINSLYGEEMGDELLKFLASTGVNSVPRGIVGRYGSDQIIAVIRNVSSDIENHIAESVNYFVENAPIPNISLKVGIYESVDRSLPVAQMCDRALLALRAVKHDYRRLYAKFDGPVSQQQLRSQNYEMRFAEAIRNHEFEAYYQPKYDPYTEIVVGAEALVRWNTPEGMISPGQFLESFEENGLIMQLDEYMFRQVCAQQKKWQDAGYTLIPISVNLSRMSLFSMDIVERFKSIAAECDIDPKFVPIEITESAAVSSAMIKPIVDAFYEAGFRLHMDDFGSGRSSLNGLNVLHFDVVKLDKSLIDFIGDPQGDLILTYTIALAKELGLKIVAEGVETEEQIVFLKDNGCDAVQGYYFSKALPQSLFEDEVTRSLDPISSNDIRGKRVYSITAIDHITKLAMDKMIHCLPGGFFTYEAHGSNKILSSNSYLWKMFGCSSEEEFLEHVHGSFKGMVCPEDLDRIEGSIVKQIKETSDELDYVEYNIPRKDGTKMPVVDYGRLYHQDNTDVFYVFISENVVRE